MTQAYSDPKRADDKWSLPDVEIWYVDAQEAAENNAAFNNDEDMSGGVFHITEAGWYYWFCLPGCMPDSEPFGPFETEAEALEDAQSQND